MAKKLAKARAEERAVGYDWGAWLISSMVAAEEARADPHRKRSHDLRGPLSVATNAAYILRREREDVNDED